MDVGTGPFELLLLIFGGMTISAAIVQQSCPLCPLCSLSLQGAVSPHFQHGLAFSPAFPKHFPLYAPAFFHFGKAARIYMESLPVQGAFPEHFAFSKSLSGSLKEMPPIILNLHVC